MYSKVLLKSQDSILQTIEHEFRWTRPQLVPSLATRCISGEVLTHRLMMCHADLQQFHSWSLDACTLHGASVGLQGVLGCQGVWGVTYQIQRWAIAKYSWNWRQSIADNSTWAEINWTEVSIILGHEIALLGVHLSWVSLTVNVKVTLHLTVYVKLTWHSTALGH